MVRSILKRVRKSERGAALVEFAIILPILLGAFGVVIDVGEAWFGATAVQTGVRTASVTAFDAGTDFDHDFRVISSVLDELDSEKVDRVVIYNVDALAGADIPAGCYATAEKGGVVGICTSYTGAFLDRVDDGTAKAEFNPSDCSTSADSSWCSTTRGGSNASFNLGIEVTVTDDALIGFMPFFREYTVTKHAIAHEIVRD